ncbi:MAG: hypothetical protein FJ280_07795 [Planctomycetes bacterium]|nr:hypothetical protein [Planctomycetota bacterium]
MPRRVESPNVLRILADQHHAGCPGCMGHPQLRTPHLDARAAQSRACARAVRCADEAQVRKG